uniref:Uncharacterized protein n=1 Tax=Arundo donax TaxID=35708 RepID=A0A0A9BH18_ARUDO
MDYVDMINLYVLSSKDLGSPPGF